MADDSKLMGFMSVTGADSDAARHFLEASNWNLDAAISQYLDVPDEVRAPDRVKHQRLLVHDEEPQSDRVAARPGAFADYRRMLAVSRLAHTDEMTNLANRRAFMQRARKMFATTDLEFGGLSAFIVDLDHFKKVNDAYGHEAGDEVLIHASRQIVAALPDDALVARLGGEEFGVLVRYENVAEINQMAEAVRHHVASKPCAYNEHRIQVSASVGVGIANPRDSIGSVMTRADDALYEAKNEGRNRFVIAA